MWAALLWCASACAAASDQTEQVTKGSASDDGGVFTFACLGAAAAMACMALARIKWFRVHAGVGPRTVVRPEVCAAGFAGAIVVGALAATAADQAWPTDNPLQRNGVTSLASGAVQIAWLVCVLLLARRATEAHANSAPEQKPLRLDSPSPRWEAFALLAITTILAWPTLKFFSILAAALEQWWTAIPHNELGHETLQELAQAPARDVWWWLMIFNAVIVAPTAEELLHRGVLQQGLKRMGLGRVMAVAVTAATFSALHWSALPDGARYTGLFTLLLLGVYWGWLYERTGRLSVCVVAHALFNAANLLFLPAGPAPGP